MKFSKLSQLFLVSSIGLIVAALLTACQLVTIDYVFVAASAGNTAGSAGQIYTYAVDAQSGALRSGASTVSSGGTAPVAMAVTPDYANLYVANQGNNTIVQFAIDGNGVLTQKNSTPLTAPVALAVNSAGTYLYAVSGTASSGTLTEYALSSGTIGSAISVPLTVPGYSGDTILPTGVAVLANSDAVYVSAYDKSAYNPGGGTSSNANPGWLFGYAVGSGGALSAVANSPYVAGVKPSALATDPAEPLCLRHRLRRQRPDRLHGAVQRFVGLHGKRVRQDRKRTLRYYDRSARHLYLPLQLRSIRRFRHTVLFSSTGTPSAM